MAAPDYEPLDLSSFYNAGTTLYAPQAPYDPTDPEVVQQANNVPGAGHQTFRGLPFQIGSQPGAPCYINFESGARAPVVIPVGRTARRVLFAHALRESRIYQGDNIGRVAARYVFVLNDGRRIEAPVRERFEIAIVHPGWGQLPFLAVPDEDEDVFGRNQRLDGPAGTRERGLWGQAGFRQTEARQAAASNYYLWGWENPAPEQEIVAVEIHPTGDLAFIVAGITLGHRDEDPLRRPAAVAVKVTLPRAEDAARDFDLDVHVDRGTATYPFPLPQDETAEFIGDTRAGWGEKQNDKSSPAYVEIAALPSATVRVTQGTEELGAANWGEVEARGKVETERVHIELVDTGRNWVHTTVLDDATGRSVPCRVHFRSPHGVPYAPHGHHAHVNSNNGSWHIDVGGDVRLGQISYAYIDGKCQGWLPRGEVIVDVARGYEYEPLRAQVSIEPGQRELTLRLKRHTDMNAARYFSGDTHVHFLSTQGALTEAAGEDLDVVNLLLSQWGHLFTNTEEFTGRPVAAFDGETIVHATQENRQHILGHLTLLGLKEPVMPWCSGGPAESELGTNLEVTMSHWADACHAQGGTVVLPHIPNPNGEPAAMIATGRVDAVEMLVHDAYPHQEYYRFLNGGYRLPLVGGTDKMDAAVPVGIYRTYAHIPDDQPFTYENWCRALQSGNTFLSGGPLLRFTVDGQTMGSTLRFGKGGGTVEVEAVATCIFPINTLQIVQGGHVVAATEEIKGSRELHLRATLKVEGDTWLCARCAGPNYFDLMRHHDSWGRGIMAHTSPVYIACGGDYNLFSAETAHYMLTLIDGSLQHIRHQAPQWKPGTVTHHHHHHDHQEFLESPFQEAIAAIHRKMHQHGIPH